MGLLAQDGLEEGGLARPVGADEGHDLAAVDVQVDGAQNRLALGHHPQACHPQTARPLAAVAAMLVYAQESASLTVAQFCSIARM